MYMRARRGQSILEYATLLALIVSALLIMQFYVKRAYQGRLKDEADQVGQQYSPGHTVGYSQVSTYSTTQTRTGGKISIRDPQTGEITRKDIPAGMTVSKSHSTTTTSREEKIDAFAAEK
jgi:hypothetical protein